MRKPDIEVREVVCSETGKPMTKIPLWMADIKVKFVSDEARQKHPTPSGVPNVEPIRRSMGVAGDVDEIKDPDTVGVANEEDADFEEVEPDAEETAEEDFGA